MRGAGRRGARLQRGRRHQGDAARQPGTQALIGANRGCYEAFAAVYECEVPVVAAVHGLLPGRRHRPGRQRRRDRRLRRRDLRAARAGPGRARRGHPPGPAGPAAPDARPLLHLAHRDRRRAARARLGVAGRPARGTARRRPGAGRARSPPRTASLIRLAKAAINGIDPVDVRRSYRFEQGFTFEANLSGVADRVRDTFGKEARPVSDKTHDGRRGRRPAAAAG